MVSTSQYAQSLTWLQALTGIIERLQVGFHPVVRCDVCRAIYVNVGSQVEERHVSLWDAC